MKFSSVVLILSTQAATVVDAISLQMIMVEPTGCTGDWSVSPESPYLCLAGPNVGETEYEQDFIQFDAPKPDWTGLPSDLVVVYTSPNHKVSPGFFRGEMLLFSSYQRANRQSFSLNDIR